MYYDSSLGRQGNIEKALRENQLCSNEIFNEENRRRTADDDNRIAVEQMLTDQYLDGIQAQQDLTDLMLEVEEMKGE